MWGYVVEEVYHMKSGYCACGCGRKTTISKVTHRPMGRVKGRPMKFIGGHQHRVYRPSGSNFHEPWWYAKSPAAR